MWLEGDPAAPDAALILKCALGQFPLLDLASGGRALGELLDAELALDARTALELDGLVGHDLKVVAPGVEEVEAPRARVHDRQPLALDGRPYRVDVVDHEPEMALVVPRLPAALHESDELVAHVDERCAGRTATQLEIEEAPVQRERGIEIADLERHVVYADQLRPRLHGLKHRLAGMSMAGYSGTPLPRKLGIGEGSRVLFADAPDGFATTLGEVPASVELVAAGEGAVDVAVLFARDAAALRAKFAGLAASLQPAGGLWVAWPKRSSGVSTDLDENLVREIGLAEGLVDNKVCAIDATWSGLRFVWRLRDRPQRA